MMGEARARTLVETGRKRVAFGADHKSFGEFILSDQVRDPTAEVAEDISKIVAAGSARSEGDSDDGHMADKWEVNREAGTRKVHRALRVRVDVHNPDIAAAAAEFGAGQRAGQRTRLLAKTASTFGDFHDHGSGKK